MKYILLQFANASGGESDLFGSLGINWKMLLLQLVAFLILLAILKKWVYPPLVTMLDKRDAQIRESAELAQSAKKEAEAAGEKTAKLLKEARKEATDIVTTARDEATNIVETAHTKAADRANALIETARGEITSEVEAAKKALYNETLELVAEATGTILKEKVDTKADAALIEQAVKEAHS